jgi:hypothetical protein
VRRKSLASCARAGVGFIKRRLGHNPEATRSHRYCRELVLSPGRDEESPRLMGLFIHAREAHCEAGNLNAFVDVSFRAVDGSGPRVESRFIGFDRTCQCLCTFGFFHSGPSWTPNRKGPRGNKQNPKILGRWHQPHWHWRSFRW